MNQSVARGIEHRRYRRHTHRYAVWRCCACGQTIKEAAARLFTLRRATTPKPFIILIDDISRLPEFDVRIYPAEQTFLKKIWPGKVSVILPCWTKRFSVSSPWDKHTGLPSPKVKETSETTRRKPEPLLAPSANPEGQQPAKTITEAKKYFGNTVGCVSPQVE